MKTEIDFEQRKLICRELLHQFHLLCESNNLRYSLGFGSLLGAVRHSGMIPWDDDIDILMPRDDYNKLQILNNCPNSIERFQVVNHRLHPEIKTKISYFIDFTTSMVVGNIINKYQCVHIDIYPIDILPANYFKKKVLLIKRAILLLIIRAKDLHPELFGGIQRYLRFFIKIVVVPFNYDKVLDKLDSICDNDSEQISHINEASCLMDAGKVKIFPSNVLNNYKLYNFDGCMYYGFSDYDSPLKAWYGDYLTLPPESERIIHDNKWVHYYYKYSN